MNLKTFRTEAFGIRFCALAKNWGDISPPGACDSVIAILTIPPGTNMAIIRVRPAWESLVPAEYLPDIQQLFSDFEEDGELDPNALLDYLSALNLGPLVTFRAGTDLASDPELRQLYEEFRPL